MNLISTEAAATAWKRQIDLGLQVAEAIVEGTQKAREIQRNAAAETHAWLEAARKTLGAAPPGELAALDMRLAQENFAKMGQYWAALATNVRDTQSRIFELLMRNSAATPLLAEATPGQPADVLNEMVDAGYKQWLNTLRSFYAAPAAAGPG